MSTNLCSRLGRHVRPNLAPSTRSTRSSAAAAASASASRASSAAPHWGALPAPCSEPRPMSLQVRAAAPNSAGLALPSAGMSGEASSAARMLQSRARTASSAPAPAPGPGAVPGDAALRAVRHALAPALPPLAGPPLASSAGAAASPDPDPSPRRPYSWSAPALLPGTSPALAGPPPMRCSPGAAPPPPQSLSRAALVQASSVRA
jgi:hypothetical protein